MAPFDPRTTPARPDLAARHLQGRVAADRFVDGTIREVVAPQAPVRRVPSTAAGLDTEALRGERVVVYETTGEGWCWGQLEDDHHVGWLPADALAAPQGAPTHKVTALRTIVFSGPSIKLPPLESLSFGARVRVSGFDGDFAVIPGGHLPARHLGPLGVRETDFVAVAERFIGVPYLWGGKTSLGIDCSGLVQVALASIGIAGPRDSDMQEQALGAPVDPGPDFAGLCRGDLVFWNGHVAIVRDPATLVHATAFGMAVMFEPVADAIRRFAAAGVAVSSVRRLG